MPDRPSRLGKPASWTPRTKQSIRATHGRFHKGAPMRFTDAETSLTRSYANASTGAGHRVLPTGVAGRPVTAGLDHQTGECPGPLCSGPSDRAALVCERRVPTVPKTPAGPRSEYSASARDRWESTGTAFGSARVMGSRGSSAYTYATDLTNLNVGIGTILSARKRDATSLGQPRGTPKTIPMFDREFWSG
jgi:hypothetical protein